MFAYDTNLFYDWQNTNTTLVQLSETKFLGVILSSDLSWSKLTVI